MIPKSVLITGTTSGLGLGFLRHFAETGAKVTAVNRREDPEWASTFPRVNFAVLDITNYSQVLGLVSKLEAEGLGPDLFILNAGINLSDNVEAFEYLNFKNVLDTNLMGVMTFVGAANQLNLAGRTLVSISSTSNIVSNPGHVGYFLSKWALVSSFSIFHDRHVGNLYKTVILGPVHTRIMRLYPPPEGFQGKLFNFLAVDVETVVRRCTRFFHGRSRVLYYPLGTCLFYLVVRALLCLFPFVYSGTKVASKASPPLLEKP